VVKLKKVKQGNKMMEEFVQEFRRIVRESKYEREVVNRRIQEMDE